MEGDDAAFRFLFRHFLSLGFLVEDFDEKGRSRGVRGFCTSGTLFKYGEGLSILTAGHVIGDIDRMVTEGNFKIRACYLLDNFGHEGVFSEPIAFDYDAAPKSYIYDKQAGLDFGLILLRDYYPRLIAKNGLKFIHEANWRLQHKVKFDFYLMLGLPSCWTHVRIFEGANKEQKIEFLPTATCFRVDRRKRKPGGYPPTQYRRFIGHIPPKVKIDNIEGMSGGPIFGFRKNGDGLAYWMVAVQSVWIEKKRITFACPLPTIGKLIDTSFEILNDEVSSASIVASAGSTIR